MLWLIGRQRLLLRVIILCLPKHQILLLQLIVQMLLLLMVELVGRIGTGKYWETSCVHTDEPWLWYANALHYNNFGGGGFSSYFSFLYFPLFIFGCRFLWCFCLLSCFVLSHNFCSAATKSSSATLTINTHRFSNVRSLVIADVLYCEFPFNSYSLSVVGHLIVSNRNYSCFDVVVK